MCVSMCIWGAHWVRVGTDANHSTPELRWLPRRLTGVGGQRAVAIKRQQPRMVYAHAYVGAAAGEPARLLGYPVLIAEDMPDIASDAMAVAFGNFGAGYTVAERPDLRVLRDPFSAKPHVLFYATKRVGGDVSDFAAIKLLRVAVS